MHPNLENFSECIDCIEENFKRISDTILLTWGTPECIEYMNKLLLDSRDGERKGFPVEVAKSLMKLIEIHQVEFPEEDQTDIWGG